MTATNHALTGALIGLSIQQPLLALPLAFVSHFVLDALPHYDAAIKRSTAKFALYLMIEASLCFFLVLTLFAIKPGSWLLPASCAFLATSPDFMWAKGYFDELRGLPAIKPKYALARFHSWIQWFQKPIGWTVEALWATAMVVLLAKLI